MLAKIFNLTNAALLVALSLSTVAAWYSIIGLTAVFAGAVVPIIIMGGFLELAKITTTVWLRKYWHRCGWALKLYMIPAIILLMILTSMGIFGFLSKAHSDQGMISGDVQAKLAIYDEKIKIEKDNIDTNRKALKQMDEAVDQVMGRSSDEKGADKAVAIRRSQQQERGRLLREISESQKKITSLNEERAPIAAENRKVEAEVGPIKYIAALIYGDNPDANLLERAVRWVIILLVIVFDPLAIALVLAANQSREWDNERTDDENAMAIVPPNEADTRPFTEEEMEALDKATNTEEEKPWYEKFPYLNKPFKHFNNTKPMVSKPDPSPLPVTPEEDEVFNELEKDLERKLQMVRQLHTEPLVVEEIKEEVKVESKIETDGVTKEYRNTEGPYVEVEGKHMHENVAKRIYPTLELSPETEGGKTSIKFGTNFPNFSQIGDIFTRVDTLPHKVFKFNGKKWIDVDKSITSVYLSTTYIEFLVSKISSGEYDPDLLTATEQDEIENFIKNQNG